MNLEGHKHSAHISRQAGLSQLTFPDTRLELIFTTPDGENTGSLHSANNLLIVFSSAEIGQEVDQQVCWLQTLLIKKHSANQSLLVRAPILYEKFSWSPPIPNLAF